MSEKNSSQNKVLLVYVALVVITFATYWQVLSLGLTNYDDDDYVGRNPLVQQGLTWAGVKWALTAKHASNWHPLTWLSHMLDVTYYGLKPAGHHLTNVFFHAANTVLVFVLLRCMTGAIWRSATVAALFALHPLHVESVAWVSERKDVLSTFFGLLTLWTYTRHVQKQKSIAPTAEANSRFTFPLSRFYWLALLFFALGLLSKPMLVTWPFLMLLLDYWPLQRVTLPLSRERWKMIASLCVEKAPFFLLAIGSCIITCIAQTNSVQPMAMGLRIQNATLSYARYLQKMIWPEGLAAFYPYPDPIPMDTVAVSALFLVVITVLCLVWVRSRPWVFTGWFWYLGTLVPVIGLLQVGYQAMADRYTYFPLIGIFITIVWTISELSQRFTYRRAVLATSAALVLAACAAQTWMQIPHWRDTRALFTQAVRVTKNNYVAHYNIGCVFVLERNWEAAEEQLRAAIEIKPKYDLGQTALGGVLLELGRRQEAIEHLEAAVRINSNQDKAHFNLGLAFAALGKDAEAAEHFSAVTRLVPSWANAHTRLGASLARQGKQREAIASWRNGLVHCPDEPDLLNNLAWALATGSGDDIRNGEEATQLAARACELSQYQRPEMIGTLAAAHAEAGRFSEAVNAAATARDSATRANDTALAGKCSRMLELFQANKPYREAPNASAPAP